LFSEFLKNVGDFARLPGLNVMIQIVKSPVQAFTESVSDAGLAGAHESSQKNCVDFWFFGIWISRN
jgi:hypothetical protein